MTYDTSRGTTGGDPSAATPVVRGLRHLQHRYRVERSEPGILVSAVEMPTDFTDIGPNGSVGYRITVQWSEEDDAWIAELHGCEAGEPTIGVAPAKEEALCQLSCCLAGLADVWQRLSEEEAAKRPPKHREIERVALTLEGLSNELTGEYAKRRRDVLLGCADVLRGKASPQPPAAPTENAETNS